MHGKLAVLHSFILLVDLQRVVHVVLAIGHGESQFPNTHGKFLEATVVVVWSYINKTE